MPPTNSAPRGLAARVVRPARVTTGQAGPHSTPESLTILDPGPARLPHPAPPEPCAVTDLVAALQGHWIRTGADIATRVRPGATEDSLDAAEDRVGLALPPGARAWWRCMDGVDPVRTRYRSTAPSVGPGGWVPLSLEEALRRAAGDGPGLPCPPALLPLFARDEELIAVGLGRERTRVEQVLLSEDGDAYQHGWRVDLVDLLKTWERSLLAAVQWLPDAHDWVTDPFALQALPNAYLID